MASPAQRGPSFLDTVKSGFLNLVSNLPFCAPLAAQKCPYTFSNPVVDDDIELMDFAAVKTVEPEVIVLPPKPKRPMISVKPEGLRFATVVLPNDSAEVLPLTITSTGSDTLLLGGMLDTSEGDFELKIGKGYQASLEPGDSAVVKYVFRPQARGDKNATFTVSSNAMNPEAGRASLSGLAKQKVKPVAVPGAKAIAVKGARTTLALSADVAEFTGNGVLTVAGSSKVNLYRDRNLVALEGNQATFELPGPINLEVEGVEGSTSVDDVQFHWELKDGGQFFVIQPAATEKLTVVKATLDIHKKSGAALGADEKKTVGRVIHVQNAEKERARAKIVVTCLPAAFAGQVKLSADADNIEIYKTPTEGEKVDLPLTLDVGSGKTPATFYVQGKDISGAVRDTGLKLQIVDPALDADEVKITVVETRLEICEKRVSDLVDPVALKSDVKGKEGRTIYKQNTKVNKYMSDRAKMRLTMTPHDAPCALILKSDGDKVTVFPERATLRVTPVTKPAYDESVELERHSSAEAAETIPKTIEAGKMVKDIGLVFWAEGKTITGGGKQLFHVDIDEVDEKCDTVAVEVKLPRLDVEVTRSDTPKRDLSAAVTVKLSEGASAGSFDTTLKGEAHRDVEVDEYAIALELHGEEKGTKPEEEWRVTRTDPDDSQTRVLVKEPRTVKFVLDPPYLKVQFIAYGIKTGAYNGTDDPALFTGTPEEKKEKAALHDIEERCKIMDHAILQAKGNPKVEAADKRVLKIFMAPEFYFRGLQGGYPIDTIHKLLGFLKEPGKGDYADWLFVFGSAIGYLEQKDKGPKTPAQITGIGLNSIVKVSFPKVSKARNVDAGWSFVGKDKNGTAVSIDIDAILSKDTDGGTMTVVMDLVDGSNVSSAYPIRVTDGGTNFGTVTLQGDFKRVFLDVDSATEIKKGALIEQGTTKGMVRKSALTGGTIYDLEVHIPMDKDLTFGPVDFTEPGESEMFNVALVKKGGSGTPVKADGSGQKELLVYKEVISSVDFAGPDYDTQAFYQEGHHIIKLHGDVERRVLPTQGSTDDLGQKPNPQKVGGVSEVNKSGLGGGMVFTMDGITFGVEVCLDHGEARLKNYYDPLKGGAPPASEPNVQIHLIPSCGMSIANPCVVTDGLVFNVDKDHEAAEDAGRGSIGELADAPIVGGPSTTAYFPTSGRIVVYELRDRPKKTTM